MKKFQVSSAELSEKQNLMCKLENNKLSEVVHKNSRDLLQLNIVSDRGWQTLCLHVFL